MRNALLLLAFLLSSSTILLGQAGGQPFWVITGNSNIDVAGKGHYFGTRNAQDIVFKTNDVERMRINADGTISYEEDAHFRGNVLIDKNLIVGQNTNIQQDLDIDGNANVDLNLTVRENATFAKDVNIRNDLDVDRNVNVDNDFTLGNNATIGNDVNIQNDLDVDRNVNIDNVFTLGNNATIGNDVNIQNDLDVDRNANVDNDFTLGNNATIGNDVNIQNDLDVDRNANVDNDFTLGNNATIGNDVNIQNDLDVDRNANVDNDFTLGNNATIGNDVNIQNDLDVDRNVNIDNDFTLGNNATIGNDVNIQNDLDVDRNANVDNDFTLGNNATIGNDVNIQNDLDVDNSANVDINLTVGNDVTITNDLTVNNDITGNVDLTINNDITGNNDLTIGFDGTIGQDLTVVRDFSVGAAAIIADSLQVGTNTAIGNDLVVGFDGTIGQDLDVIRNFTLGRDATIADSLQVGKNTLIGGILTVEGDTNLDTLNVNKAAKIDETLEVDQLATLSELLVENQAKITDTLTTDQAIIAKADVRVGENLQATGLATLDGGLEVNEAALFNGQVSMGEEADDTAFNVTADDQFEYPFYLRVKDQELRKFYMDSFGQIYAQSDIRSNPEDGDQEQEVSDYYGFVLQAQSQGMYIMLDTLSNINDGSSSATPFTDHNFISFANNSEEIFGRIEATTNPTNPSSAQDGVTLVSGGADYAEWLPRASETEEMTYGDIVGVKGGHISKNTADVDHFMVISSSPVVLGNMQKKAEESSFEKVAFMGQVPVKVLGSVAIGDYILPDGNHEGVGIAKPSADMTISDFGRIVGVAWQASDDENVKFINTAIGLNHNDLLTIIAQQQAKIDELNSDVSAIKAMLNMDANTSNQKTPDSSATDR